MRTFRHGCVTGAWGHASSQACAYSQACDYQECAPSVRLGVCTDLREGGCVLGYLSCMLRGAASGARGQGPVPVPACGWGRDTRAGPRQRDRMVRAGVIDSTVEGVVCAV